MNPEFGLSRRNFIRSAFGGLVLTVIAPHIASADEVCRTLFRIPTDSCTKDVLKEIKQFEAKLNTNPLEFIRAKDDYLPLVIKLLTQSVPTLKTEQQFKDKSFILRGSWLAQDEVFPTDKEQYRGLLKKIQDEPNEQTLARPIMNYLLTDYPDFHFTQDDEAKDIVYTSTYASGLKLNDRAYFYLDLSSAEKTLTTVRQTEEDGMIQTIEPNWLFLGPGPQTNCFDFKPAANFRSLVLHELIHLDTEPKFEELEDDALASCRRVLKNEEATKNLTLVSGVKNAFGVVLHFQDQEGRDIDGDFLGLEEFATDYLASSITVMNNLTYTLAKYGRPNHYAAFTKILEQSKWSVNDSYILHRDRDVNNFLHKVASGLENPNFTTSEGAYDFVVKNLLLDLLGADRPAGVEPFPTKILKPYFPSLDIDDYDYVNPAIFKSVNGSKPGCII